MNISYAIIKTYQQGHDPLEMARQKLAKHKKSLTLGYQHLFSHYYNDSKDTHLKLDFEDPVKILKPLAIIGNQSLGFLAFGLKKVDCSIKPKYLNIVSSSKSAKRYRS